MCLPLGCLKTWTTFLSSITLLGSIAAIIVGIIAVTKNFGDFFKYTDWEVYVYGPAILITLGVFILILSLFGIIGSVKKNGCCIAIYNFGNIPFSLCFIVLGIIIASVLSSQTSTLDKFIKNENDCINAGSSGSRYKWIQGTEELVNRTIYAYGKTDQIVYINPTDDQNFTTRITTYMNATTNVSTSTTITNALPVINLSGPEVGYELILQFQERVLKCSGMCLKSQYYYLFTDINKGFTKGHDEVPCISYLNDFLKKYGQLTMITVFLAGGLLLLNSVLTFCICCHPENKGKNYYTRMSNAYE